jgi:hypothetical protein
MLTIMAALFVVYLTTLAVSQAFPSDDTVIYE